MVNFEYPPLGGGGGVATQHIARELAKRHGVWVLTSAQRGGAGIEVSGALTVVRVPVIGRRSLPTASLISLISFIPISCFRIMGLCLRHRFDVINAQFVIPSGIPAALAAFVFRIPLVISFIGGDIYDPTKGISPHRHWWLRLAIRLLAQQAKGLTAISSDTKRRVRELHGVRGEISITHLGHEAVPTPKLDRAEMGLPPGKIICVSVGRLIPRKAYDVLLDAWKHVRGADLFIIGNGPLQQVLQRRIEDNGLSDRVHVLTSVSDQKKRQILLASDIYVSAAEHEGFGIVFLEAMDAHLPIVAVNEGGQTDFLAQGKNALLVEVHSAEAIASAVNQLVSDASRRQAIGEANARRVKDFYLPKTVAVFEAALRRAIAKSKPDKV